MKIDKISIKRFRGIKELDFSIEQLSMLIGNNGTSKTTILEAIHYCLSPSFLSSRIKLSDFYLEEDEPIEITITFDQSFTALLPDGFAKQEIPCNKVYLRVKKRNRAAPNKAFSDLVVVEHFVIPNWERETNDKGEKLGWAFKRKNGSSFKFTERLLSFPVETMGLIKSYYYGKNREKQLQKGFNSSISSVFDDFNWRFTKNVQKDLTEKNNFLETVNTLEQTILAHTDDAAFDKTFKAINEKLAALNLDHELAVSFIKPSIPFDNAYLTSKNLECNIDVSLLGSGIEIIISLIFLETLASLSKSEFILLIDEPELHLHPILQTKLATYLLQLSDTKQIAISTHSPYFFKNCVNKSGVNFILTKKSENNLVFEDARKKIGFFEWSPTWAEINYIAYDYTTIELHNEMYGYIQEKSEKWKEKDFEEYLQTKGISKTKKWTRIDNGVVKQPYDISLMSYIRHKIHHPENQENIEYTETELRESIEQMSTILKSMEGFTA